MKIIFSLILFLALMGHVVSFADEHPETSSLLKMIHDEKYGDISDEYFIYRSLTSVGDKTAKLNLSKVLYSYQKTMDFDAVLQKEGKEFQAVRAGMVDKIKVAQSRLTQAEGSNRSQIEADIANQENNVIEYDKEERAEHDKRWNGKVLEVLADIKKVVAEYANKNQLRAVFDSRMPKLNEGIDITDEIIPILNERYSAPAQSENVDNRSGNDERFVTKWKSQLMVKRMSTISA